MSDKPTQPIIPYLYYEDVAAALQWLAKAFGFREYGAKMSRPGGGIYHAAMDLDDGIVMMGCPGPGYKSPKRLRQATQSLLVRVHDIDIDRHFERARQAGATILQAPETMFRRERRYGAADPEGHEWYFAQPIPGGKPKPRRKPARS